MGNLFCGLRAPLFLLYVGNIIVRTISTNFEHKSLIVDLLAWKSTVMLGSRDLKVKSINIIIIMHQHYMWGLDSLPFLWAALSVPWKPDSEILINSKFYESIERLAELMIYISYKLTFLARMLLTLLSSCCSIWCSSSRLHDPRPSPNNFLRLIFPIQISEYAFNLSPIDWSNIIKLS